jgi:hypothetical protein
LQQADQQQQQQQQQQQRSAFWFQSHLAPEQGSLAEVSEATAINRATSRKALLSRKKQQEKSMVSGMGKYVCC